MKKIYSLVIVLTVFWGLNTKAQWMQTAGPIGGDISSFTTDGTSLYVGTYSINSNSGGSASGVYYSANSGASWTQVNNGLTNLYVDALTMSGTTVFAGSTSGLFSSVNNGTNWTNLSNGIPAGQSIVSLAANGSTIIAGTNGNGIYRSLDGGVTWAASNTGLPASQQITSLAISGTNIFAGTGVNGVYLSVNNGANWTAVNTGLIGYSSNPVYALAIKGSNLFASINGNGVFLSTNNGTSWAAVDTGLPSGSSSFVYSFLVNGTDIFAGTEGNGVYKSTNNGTSWTAVNTGIANSQVYAMTIMGAGIFAGMQGGGVYTTTNNGVSWATSNMGLISTKIHALAFNFSELFAGAYGTGMELTSNGGISWSLLTNPTTYDNFTSFAVGSSNIFASTYGEGIILSTNNGLTWTAVNTGLTDEYISSLAISGTNTFAGNAEAGVYLSTNNGTSWTLVNTGLTNLHVHALAVNGTNIFAGTDGGVFLSTNNGTSWTAVNTGLTNLYVYSFLVNGSDLFAGTGGGVFLSTNNGTTWTPVNTGIPTNVSYTSFAISGSNIFAAGGNYVYLTTNNGTSWSNVTGNLPGNINYNTIAINGNTIYTGSDGEGVWKRQIPEIICSLNPPVMSSAASVAICSGATVNIPLTNSGAASTFSWLASDNPQTTGESTILQSTNTLSNTINNSSNTSPTTVTYTVTATANSGGCSSTPQTVTVTVNPTPVMTSNTTMTICSGQSAGLAFTSSAASSFSWIATDNPNTTGESTTPKSTNTLNDVITNNSFVPQTVTYVVTPASSGGSCTGTPQTVIVTVNPTPAMTSASSATICSGGTVNINLTSSVQSNFTWIATDNINTTGESTLLQSPATLSNTIVNNSTTAKQVIYTVTPTAVVGGCPGTQTVTITVNPAPNMTSSPAASICSGGTATINLASDIASTYSWNATSDNPNTTGESINPQSSTSLSNTITNNSTIAQIVYYSVSPMSSSGGCTGATQSVAVTVNPLPVMTSSGSATICSGGTASIPLSANIASAFSWIAADNVNTTGESLSSQSTSTLSNTITNTTNAAQNVIYTIVPTATTLGSCAGTSQTVSVTINPKPLMTSASTATICSGGTVNIPLTSSAASSYTWVAADNVNTTGESITLQSTGTLSNIISNNSTVSQNVVYTVIPTSTTGGCVGTSQTITVTVNPSPTMTNASTVAICSSGIVSLSLTSNVTSSFTWIAADNPNTTGESITSQSTSTLNNTIANNSTLAQNVIYTVTPTSTAGSCAGASQTIAVVVNPMPTLTSSNSSIICSGGTVNIPLSSSVTSSFSWIAADNVNTTGESITSQSTGTLNNTILNNSIVSQNVVYTITPTATLGGCAGVTQTVTVTVNPSPVMTSASTATICSSGNVSVSLTSNLASSFSWAAVDNINTTGESTASQSNGTLSNTITNNSSVVQNVVYSVTPTSSAGSCAGTLQTVIVSVNPAPAMTNSTTATICSGGTVSIPLTSNVASSFSWIAADNPNTTGESIASQSTSTLNNTITNNSSLAQNVFYSVTPNSTVGSCAGATQTVAVLVNPVPTMTSSNAATICSAGVVNIPFSSSVTSSFSWIAADNINTTGESLTSQSTVTLNNTITNNSIVSQNVIYTVTPTATFGGCSGTDQTITITVNPTPAMINIASATICSNGAVSIPLTSNIMSSYSWVAADNINTIGESTTSQSSGTLSNTITNNSSVAQNVIYSVIPSSSSGSCAGTAQTITVTINPAPTMTNTTSATICSGGSVNIPLTSNAASSFTWIAADNPNTIGESITSQLTGTINNTIINNSTSAQNVIYTITPTSTTGSCAGASQTVTVVVNPVPSMNSSAAASICSGGTVNIFFSSSVASSYNWIASDNLNTTGENITSQSTGELNNTIINNSIVSQNVIYTVSPTATLGGCVGTVQTVTVTVNPLPTMTSISTATICSGTTVTVPLTSDVTSSYSWSAINNVNTTGESISSQSTGTLNNTITNNSSVVQNVVYTITPTSTAGNCAGTDQTVIVTVNPSPLIINNLNASICSGGTVSISLISNINSTFSWIATDNLHTTGESLIAQTRDTLLNTIVNSSANVQNVVYTITPTSIAGGCAGGQQTISVLVNPLDNANFSYSSATFCQSGNDPSALITGLFGGAFSSTPGLVFLNTNNGLVNLSASALGAHIITYTTNSTCSNSHTFNLTITTAPSASFSYTGSPYCRNVINPLPIFGTGSSAGVFSANPSGLAFVSTVTGEINLAGSIPGTYTITNTIAASGDCASDIAAFAITINPLPVVSFNGLAASYYYNDASVSLIGIPSGGTFSGTGTNGNLFSPVTAGGGTFSISYSYTDGNGCSNTSPSQSTIVLSKPAPPDICEVTVDDSSHYNIIYWDKTNYTNVDSFIVYREISNNNYQRVGAVTYTALSEFIDTARYLYFPNTGNPNAGTYRYKLQIKDLLGHYSPLSPFHNTIYINQNFGTFTWNYYEIEGQTVPLPSSTLITYDLYRDDNSNGNWHIVNSIAGSQLTQSDIGWTAALQNTASWRVETNWNITCNPTRSLVNSSHSNIRHPGIIITTGMNQSELDNAISIYPNPANDMVFVQLGIGAKNTDIRIFNVVGELVYQSEIFHQQTTIDVSSFAKGVYSIEVKNKDARVVKKLVVQ